MLTYHVSLRRKLRDVRYPLTVGNLVHGALEVFYLAGGIHGDGSEDLAREFLKDKRADDLAECAAEHEKVIIKSHKTAEACLDSYLHWLEETGIDNEIEIIGTEDKISLDGILDGCILNGRIDLLARCKVTGDIIVIDFKLVQSISDKIRMLHLDQQAKAYALLAHHKYGKPVKVYFRIVKINQRSATVKGPQEENYIIHLNPAQLDVYRKQLGGMFHDILEAQDRLNNDADHQEVAYPSPSDSCSWKCEFFPVCPMLDDPHSDGLWLLNDAFESKFAPIQDPGSDVTVDESTPTDLGDQL
jgi:hypothetical protein